MIDNLEAYAAYKAYQVKSSLQGACRMAWDFNTVQWMIVFGVLLTILSLGFANYVAVVETIGNLEHWYLPGLVASAAFFMVEGLALIFVAGWISNKLRGGRRR